MTSMGPKLATRRSPRKATINPSATPSSPSPSMKARKKGQKSQSQAKLNVQRMLKLPFLSHTGGILAKPSIRGSWKTLPKMFSNMKESVKDLYEESAFKHFVRVPKLKGDGIIIHMMLLHQIHPEKGEHSKDGVQRLHFKIGDKTLSYGPLEFCIRSGLRFGSYAKTLKAKRKWLDIPEKQSQFSTRVFPDVGKGKLTNQMLEKLVFGDKLAGLSDNDALRACLLYTLVCSGFLGNNAGEKIGEEWLVMIDDLKLWNSYVWGSELYDHSFEQLSSMYGKIDKELKKKADRGRTIKYGISGFTLPFQVWIWESLACMHGKYIEKVYTGIPRATRWTSRVHVRWPDVFKIFEEAKTDVRRFDLEEEEKGEEYYGYFCKHMGVEKATHKSMVDEIQDVKELAVETNSLSKTTHDIVVGLLKKDQQKMGTVRLEDFFDGSMLQTPIHATRNDWDGPGNVDQFEHNTDSMKMPQMQQSLSPQKQQNTRKRKQHSSAGLANSSAGPSPSTPASTQRPCDGASSLQHVNNNVQQSNSMYSVDGTGGLSSTVGLEKELEETPKKTKVNEVEVVTVGVEDVNACRTQPKRKVKESRFLQSPYTTLASVKRNSRMGTVTPPNHDGGIVGGC